MGRKIAYEKTAGKFGFPFDVDKFSDAFPNNWTLIDNYSREDGNLIYGPGDSKIAAAHHKISATKSLAELVEEFAEQVDSPSNIIEHETSIGTKFFILTFLFNDEGEQKKEFMIEVMGPKLMSVRFIYSDNKIEQEIVDVLTASVINLDWYASLPESTTGLKDLTLKELRQQIRKVLKNHAEQKESLLSTFDDEDCIYLYPFEVEELIDLAVCRTFRLKNVKLIWS